jgi:hypothetical protein
VQHLKDCHLHSEVRYLSWIIFIKKPTVMVGLIIMKDLIYSVG